MTMDTTNPEEQQTPAAVTPSERTAPVGATPDDAAPVGATPDDAAPVDESAGAESAGAATASDGTPNGTDDAPTGSDPSDDVSAASESADPTEPALTPTAVTESQQVEEAGAAAAASLFGEVSTSATEGETDTAKTETAAGEQRSAAEREYQEAMAAAKSLGLDKKAKPSSVDHETDAAQRLVETLGLSTPPETPEGTAAPPGMIAETAADERTRRQAEVSARREEEEEILGPEPIDTRAWYVINTYSGHENRVKVNLTRRIASMDVAERIFRVEVPTEEELEIRGGQRRQVQRKLLPGYVLAEMILDDDTWYVVRNTPGVTGFVGSEKPHALPRSEVLGILKQMRQEAPRVRVGFEIDDTVRVREGPFEDFMGQVDEINLDKGKVRVMISMFGRDTPVELDFLQVEKA